MVSIKIIENWFLENGWSAFPFQKATWEAYLNQDSGIVNAPTGSGKTYSLMMPILIEGLNGINTTGLQAIWITPIRALTKEIREAGQRAVDGLNMQWKVEIRTGDTSTDQRKKQWKNPPQIIVTTPESIHVLLTSPGYPNYFKSLKVVVVDEWHELMGSKRGVLVELALSRFKNLAPGLKIWGISATIGNMEQAMEVLFGNWYYENQNRLKFIRSDIKKEIKIETIIPDEIETYPWAGHLGIRLIEKVLPIIYRSRSTLLFTNTRGQCEIWYQKLLDLDPGLSGLIAMHHGSISRELRDWVEESLHSERIKAVVCTSSLDLGVDFRPVETVIQIGSPKGVARFVQRAGRSGHQPGATSKIYFLPTHALEILEGAALKEAIRRNIVEDRIPFYRSFDVLIQYILTLAISEGFFEDHIKQEIKTTFSYQSISDEEWSRVLYFSMSGGSLEAYEEYKKLGKDRLGKYRVVNKRVAQRHRLSIGTIVGDQAMVVKYLNGKNIGNVEERFITRLSPGERFWFAGRSLELVRIKGNNAFVRRAHAKDGKTPSWQGGRMSFSSQLSQMLRYKLDEYTRKISDPDVATLEPILSFQDEKSMIPDKEEFLIEYFEDRDGFHLVMFPFEGRYVHEGMSALMAYRIGNIKPLSFSIAMNDYGFELLSDKPIPIEQALDEDLFNSYRLQADIMASINSIEMAKKRFRDIASIAGLVFRGFPGRYKKERHLETSSQLIFEVFKDYDPNNLLYLQAFDEVLIFQLEESRLRKALHRIQRQKIILSKPDMATPFSFPILVDGLRERMSTEKLIKRIERMKLQLDKS